MSKCYDCRQECTKDYEYIDVLSEDGNQIRVAIHKLCHARALNGGEPVYPETATLTNSKELGANNNE